MDINSELYPTKQAGAYLGDTSPATMQWWRTSGRGPKYLKIGRRVFYRKSDLEAFINAGEHSPEMEAA